MNPASASPRRRATSLLSLAASSAALAPQVAEAAPGDPIGAPIPVASGVFGGHVARAGNGRMVASYLAGSVLKARRYTADGTPDGAAITVTTATGGAITSGGVSMDADGDFVVSWGDVVDRAWQLRARRYNADGTPRGGVLEVGSTADNDPRVGELLSVRSGLVRLTVDMNPDGDFSVLWTDYRTTFVGSRIACKYLIGATCVGDVRETIRVRRYDRNGLPRAATQVVATVSGNTLDIGGVTGLNGGRILGGADVETRADGSVIAAWSIFGRVNALDRGRLYTRTYPASGLGSSLRQIGVADRVYRADLQVDSAADGSYAIVHRSVDSDPVTFAADCGVEYDLLAADGTALAPRTRIDETPFGFDCLSSPDIEMDNAGNHVVAFQESSGIKARRYGIGGTALGGLFDLTPPDAIDRGPLLASDAAGHFAVAYVRPVSQFVIQLHEGP